MFIFLYLDIWNCGPASSRFLLTREELKSWLSSPKAQTEALEELTTTVEERDTFFVYSSPVCWETLTQIELVRDTGGDWLAWDRKRRNGSVWAVDGSCAVRIGRILRGVKRLDAIPVEPERTTFHHYLVPGREIQFVARNHAKEMMRLWAGLGCGDCDTGGLWRREI